MVSKIYLLAGKEELLRKREEEKIKNSLFGKNPSSLDSSVFFAPDADIAEVLDCCRTPPFSSARRLVVLKEAERLSPRAKESLAAYCEAPSSTAVFLIETEEDEFRSPFSSQVEVISCKKLYGAALRSWAREEAARFRKKIEEGALKILEENLGNDLLGLSNALEKLSLYVENRPLIRAADVENLVGRSPENSTFELVEAISEKKIARAFRVLADLLEEGKESGEIIGLIAWQFRRIKQALELKKIGRPPAEVSRALGIKNRFFSERFLRQVNIWEKEKIETKTEKLLSFDYQIKQGRLSEARGLELLVLELGLG